MCQISIKSFINIIDFKKGKILIMQLFHNCIKILLSLRSTFIENYLFGKFLGTVKA